MRRIMLLSALVVCAAIAVALLVFSSTEARAQNPPRFADEGRAQTIPTDLQAVSPGPSSVRFGIGDSKGSTRSSRHLQSRCQRVARITIADSER
jgi:hypothetical protein